jgi:hypothetical protein
MDGTEALLGVFQGDDGRGMRCRHDRRVEDGAPRGRGAPSA